MPAIPLSYSDKVLNERLKRLPPMPTDDGRSVELTVTPIPAARNSEPFNRRRACAGNASCIPICPIQAKYDPTITLREALNTGKVKIVYRAVASNIVAKDPDSKMDAQDDPVDHIEFIRYRDDIGGSRVTCTARGKVYVLAANAIETPRLMLMSNDRRGVAHKKSPVGRYLMDHPFYIAAASTTGKDEQAFSYRGPLVTGGIEVLRDSFRHRHASFRCDVSNAGWSLTRHSTAQTIVEDFITGGNDSGMNGAKGTPEILAGTELLTRLNHILTRQVSLGFLVEQTPDEENRVELSQDKRDGLGLPRPQVTYGFSDYTREGLVQAMLFARNLYKQLGWREQEPPTSPDPKETDNCSFDVKDPETGRPITLHYMGAGHIAGTCRMGESPEDSVVDKDLKVWGRTNLYVLGSAVFPTLGTANPTLTIAALSLRLASHLEDAVLSSAPRSDTAST